MTQALVPRWKALWLKWRSLRTIPWRRSWFVGYDLSGNMYWEIYKGPGQPLRRRAVPRASEWHMSDFQPPPQWTQWMSRTRPNPPTLGELYADMQRQQRLKILAQQADERWRSVPLKSAANNSGDERLETAWAPPVAGRTPEASNAADRTNETTLEASEGDLAQQRMREAQKHITKLDDAKRTAKKSDEKSS